MFKVICTESSSFIKHKKTVGRLYTNIRENHTHPSNVIQKKYVPRRANMYVPGSDWKKIGKIASLKADSYILDCEDGVALNKKFSVSRKKPATISNKF